LRQGRRMGGKEKRAYTGQSQTVQEKKGGGSFFRQKEGGTCRYGGRKRERIEMPRKSWMAIRSLGGGKGSGKKEWEGQDALKRRVNQICRKKASR